MEKAKEKSENPKNNFGSKAAIGTLLIIVFAIGLFIIADVLFPFRGWESRAEMHQLMQWEFSISMLLSSVMFLVSIYLVYIYLKDYLELKSKFTLGVLLALVSFMLFAISWNPLLMSLFGIWGKPGAYSMIPMTFATISLVALAWVSSR